MKALSTRWRGRSLEVGLQLTKQTELDRFLEKGSGAVGSSMPGKPKVKILGRQIPAQVILTYREEVDIREVFRTSRRNAEQIRTVAARQLQQIVDP